LSKTIFCGLFFVAKPIIPLLSSYQLGSNRNSSAAPPFLGRRGQHVQQIHGSGGRMIDEITEIFHLEKPVDSTNRG
jgi:hypothetical protein